MSITYQTTYSQARANLATLCNRVENNREVILIQRRGRPDVALVDASELAGLLETAHLLRSPANAERLLIALARARGDVTAPQTMDELRCEVGLDVAA